MPVEQVVTSDKEDTKVPIESESTQETVASEEEKVSLTKAEIEKLVADKASRQAQSLKDKELKSIYEELNKLKSEKASLESRQTDEQEDSKLARLEKREKQLLGDTEEVKELQEARRELLDRERKLRDKERQWKDRETAVTGNARQQIAFTKALKLLLPENEEFLDEVNALAKEIAEADTDKEADLRYQLAELKLRAQAEDGDKKRTKPDSGLPTHSGGASDHKTLYQIYMKNPRDLKARQAWLEARARDGM